MSRGKHHGLIMHAPSDKEGDGRTIAWIIYSQTRISDAANSAGLDGIGWVSNRHNSACMWVWRCLAPITTGLFALPRLIVVVPMIVRLGASTGGSATGSEPRPAAGCRS